MENLNTYRFVLTLNFYLRTHILCANTSEISLPITSADAQKSTYSLPVALTQREYLHDFT